jgi:glucose-1-phosphate cytidylyltransferase
LKVVILAGGLGTRLSEETEVRPKPLVEIGGHPIIWHIMRHYVGHGFNEFVVALGYKGEEIKRYFLDYHLMHANLTIDLATGRPTLHEGSEEPWVTHLVDTGPKTNTGGRVKKLRSWLEEKTFMLTYGDGVCDIDLKELMRFHRKHGRLATVTAVRPPARFGGLIFDGDLVSEFTEKPQIGEGWINGGFMVMEPGIFDYLDGEDPNLESDALERLAADRQLAAYKHDHFWQCMDTLRDVRLLESLWQSGNPPWKTWE